MSKINKIVFLAIFAFHSAACFGVDVKDSINESSNQVIVQRHFNPETIEAFKSDSDFIYELPPAARPGILKMLFQKFFNWLLLIFGNELFAWLVIVILLILGVLGLGFAFYGLFGIGKTIPVYSKDDKGLDYQVKEEDINEINFIEEIDVAVDQKDYKRAVRLIYLFALKLLTDKKIIDWSPSKTNHDYIGEIRSEAYRKQFSTLSYYFEYVWYGNFQTGFDQYNVMRKTFSEFRENLKHNAQA